MQAIGILDITFILMMVGVMLIPVYRLLFPPKPREYPYQTQMDEEFRKYIESLREGGTYKDYAKAKKKLDKK